MNILLEVGSRVMKGWSIKETVTSSEESSHQFRAEIARRAKHEALRQTRMDTRHKGTTMPGVTPRATSICLVMVGHTMG